MYGKVDGVRGGERGEEGEKDRSRAGSWSATPIMERVGSTTLLDAKGQTKPTD